MLATKDRQLRIAKLVQMAAGMPRAPHDGGSRERMPCSGWCMPRQRSRSAALGSQSLLLGLLPAGMAPLPPPDAAIVTQLLHKNQSME
jgi:hypothetical protein